MDNTLTLSGSDSRTALRNTFLALLGEVPNDALAGLLDKASNFGHAFQKTPESWREAADIFADYCADIAVKAGVFPILQHFLDAIRQYGKTFGQEMGFFFVLLDIKAVAKARGISVPDDSGVTLRNTFRAMMGRLSSAWLDAYARVVVVAEQAYQKEPEARKQGAKVFAHYCASVGKKAGTPEVVQPQVDAILLYGATFGQEMGFYYVLTDILDVARARGVKVPTNPPPPAPSGCAAVLILGVGLSVIVYAFASLAH